MTKAWPVIPQASGVERTTRNVRIGRAIAEHSGGMVNWAIDWDRGKGKPDTLRKVFDQIDDFLLNRPGYRVTITVEREDGIVDPTNPELLARGVG